MIGVELRHEPEEVAAQATSFESYQSERITHDCKVAFTGVRLDPQTVKTETMSTTSQTK